MITAQSEIVIDSFAGGGGASTGIEMALRAMEASGVDVPSTDVTIAINHNGAALAMHEANHPRTIHLQADIWTVDPMATTKGRPVGLLWASPDCRHFSSAKGGAPVSESVRGLAWSIAHWAEMVQPRMIFLENVPEFQSWGPLIMGPKGHLVPDPERSGETFREWLVRFKRLGYRVKWKMLRACDYGAPTIRNRLYIIMRRDGEKIVWPAPTHGDPRSEAVQSGKLLPWRTAADIVDWDRPCASILMTKKQAVSYREDTGIRVKRPLADNTMARIAAGVKRYVLDAEKPFNVVCNHAAVRFPFVTAHYGSDIGSPADSPVRTVTGVPKVDPIVLTGVLPALSREQIASARKVAEFLRSHDAWDHREFVTVGDYVIVDIGMRMLTPRELARAQGFPEDYQLAVPYQGGTLGDRDQRHKIGNSVCPPVAAALVGANYRPEIRIHADNDQGWLFAQAREEAV